MTKKAKREHLQKLTSLFEQYPDGLNMRQIQTELQTSAVNAQAALDELGAVKDGAKWVLVDDEPAPVEVAPGAKADTVVNENFTTELSGISGELVEPLSNPYELPESETVKVVHAEPDWANAPEGATHWHENEWVRWAGKRSTKHNIWDMDAWRDGAWVLDFWGWKGSYESFLADGAIPRPSLEPDQPEEQPQGELPEEHPEGKCPVCKVATDVAPLGLDGECQMCYEDASDKAWWDEVSDYSTVFDNIKGRVLSTIKAHKGATADRLRELTGMHPDDIADAVQYMVDHKQLVSSDLYGFAVYEVAA